MTFRALFVLTAILPCLLAPSAIAAPIEAAISPLTIRDDVFPRLPVPFKGGISALPDVEYENLVGFRPLLLDLYRHDDTKTRPLVIFVHGGGMVRGDSRTSGALANFPALLASLAARGYVVASLNYRFKDEAPFPAALQDVKAAIKFLRDNAGRYGIDPARVLIWGGSAGGRLSSMVATTCGVAAYEPVPSAGRLTKVEAAKAKVSTTSDCVQGAVIWYGVFDTAPPAPGTPPMLLIHGLADTEASPDKAKEEVVRLKAAGVAVDSLFIPDVDHGFIGKTLESTRAANYQALQRTFDFFDKISGK